MYLLSLMMCKLKTSIFLFRELGVEIEPSDIVSWLDSDVDESGVQMYTDDEICELVSQSSDEIEPEVEEDKQEDEEEPCPVTNSDAAEVLTGV